MTETNAGEGGPKAEGAQRAQRRNWTQSSHDVTSPRDAGLVECTAKPAPRDWVRRRLRRRPRAQVPSVVVTRRLDMQATRRADSARGPTMPSNPNA
eukprot:356549-Chlamydomonas_euryale.AAC.2